MTSPLIDRLTDEFGWPRLDSMEAVQGFVVGPGEHCLFVPGDPAKNLETNDVAVILPEIVTAFQGRFDCAVIDASIEQEVRVQYDAWVTPGLVFVREGQIIGKVTRVQDWDDYLKAIVAILQGQATAAAE